MELRELDGKGAGPPIARDVGRAMRRSSSHWKLIIPGSPANRLGPTASIFPKRLVGRLLQAEARPHTLAHCVLSHPVAILYIAKRGAQAFKFMSVERHGLRRFRILVWHEDGLFWRHALPHPKANSAGGQTPGLRESVKAAIGDAIHDNLPSFPLLLSRLSLLRFRQSHRSAALLPIDPNEISRPIRPISVEAFKVAFGTVWSNALRKRLKTVPPRVAGCA